MVIYADEKELQWHRLLDKGLEVALVAHADTGKTHGERIGLSRAFELAEKFGAIPVDHIISYELMMRYPEQFEAMMSIVGSNHTWLSTTLCIYAGDEQININEDIMNTGKSTPKAFGYIEETGGSMSDLVLPSEGIKGYAVLKLRDTMPWIPHKLYTSFDDLLYKAEIKLESAGWYHTPKLPSKCKWKFEESGNDDLASFLYVEVPPEHRNKFNVVTYPNYSLNRQGPMVRVEVDWSKASEIIRERLEFQDAYYHVSNSSLLPQFLVDGFRETTTSFHNPTLGFFAPAESYGPHGRERGERNEPNYWRISTRGEAVIIQRPIR